MSENLEDKITYIFSKLKELIENAPSFGSVSIQIIFHSGKISRLVTGAEESQFIIDKNN